MARSRNIKPAFFQNEQLAEFEPWVRLLFVGLWTVADRAGRFEVRPKRIRAALFPYDDFDIVAGIGYLAEAGFVTLYEVGGVGYAEIANWSKHQNPHCKEQPSSIPENPGHAPGMHGASTVVAVLIPDSGFRIPDSPNRIQETRSKAKAPRRKRAALDLPTCVPGDVWADWHAYRTKRGKGWTDHAQRLSVATLTKLHAQGHDPRAVVEQSIERGWTGLFGIGEIGGGHGRVGKGAADRVADAVKRRASEYAQ